MRSLILGALALLIFFSGCVEQQISIKDLRADIPELVIDSAGGAVKIYVMGVEKYRYPRIELYVNGEKVAEEDQSLVLNYVTKEEAFDLRAIAVTERDTYSHSCRISVEDGGIRIYESSDKSERLISWKEMPYEIVMGAER